MIMKTFFALGNDHPQILIKLEDCVLQAIILISEGKLREYAMDTLYSELYSMEKDLAKDNEALTWFNLAMAPFAIPSMPHHPNSLPNLWLVCSFIYTYFSVLHPWISSQHF